MFSALNYNINLFNLLINEIIITFSIIYYIFFLVEKLLL